MGRAARGRHGPAARLAAGAGDVPQVQPRRLQNRLPGQLRRRPRPLRRRRLRRRAAARHLPPRQRAAQRLGRRPHAALRQPRPGRFARRHADPAALPANGRRQRPDRRAADAAPRPLRRDRRHQPRRQDARLHAPLPRLSHLEALPRRHGDRHLALRSRQEDRRAGDRLGRHRHRPDALRRQALLPVRPGRVAPPEPVRVRPGDEKSPAGHELHRLRLQVPQHRPRPRRPWRDRLPAGAGPVPDRPRRRGQAQAGRGGHPRCQTGPSAAHRQRGGVHGRRGHRADRQGGRGRGPRRHLDPPGRDRPPRAAHQHRRRGRTQPGVEPRRQVGRLQQRRRRRVQLLRRPQRGHPLGGGPARSRRSSPTSRAASSTSRSGRRTPRRSPSPTRPARSASPP